MAKRYKLSKQSLLSQYGDVVLFEYDTDRSPNIGNSLRREISGTTFHASVANGKDPLVISSSIAGLIRYGYVDEVEIHFECGKLGPDSVTYKWTSMDDDPWEGTYSIP